MSGWSIAEHQADGGVYVVRSRALPPADERARFPVAVWLGWSFGGVPQAQEDAMVADMLAWEDAVHAAAEANGWGMLVAVVTNGQGREWLFHAANETEFLGELRGLTEDGGWPPLDARVYDDPSWTAARELNPRAVMH